MENGESVSRASALHDSRQREVRQDVLTTLPSRLQVLPVGFQIAEFRGERRGSQ